jgi:YD repeat-containing protein
MMTKKTLKNLALAVTMTSLFCVGAQAASCINIEVTDVGEKTGRYWQREGCVAPHDAPEDNRFGDQRGLPDMITDEAECGTAEFIDVLPTVGERVALHHVAGHVPRSSEWTGVPCFGRYRFLNWMPMVTLPAQSRTSQGDGKRDYAHVLFPGYCKVINYEQGSSETEYVPVTDDEGNVTSELVPADSKITFSGGSGGLEECVLTYPDGRTWTFEYFAMDLDRSSEADSPDSGARKYRLIKHVDRHGYEVNLVYGNKQLTITDASGNNYVCSLDKDDRITEIEVGDRTWTYKYDGNTVTETNDQTGKKVAITTTYKSKNVASIIKTGKHGKKHEKIYTFNSDGELTNLKVNGVDIAVVETNSTEDFNGPDIGYPAGTVWNMDVRTREYTKGGLKVTFKYTSFGKIGDTDGRSKTVEWQRRRTQHIIKQVDRNGNVTVIDYDDNGYRTKETFAVGTSLEYEVSYTYDSNYNLITKTTPSGVWHYCYDDMNDDNSPGYTTPTPVSETVHNLLTRAYFEAGGQKLADITYERYDWGENSQGLIKLVKEKELVGDDRTLATAFEYNAGGQMTKKKGPLYSTTEPSAPIWQYGYDYAGNLHSETDPLGNTSVWYHDDGDMLLTVTDGAGNPTEYDYDGLGRRTRATDATAKKAYVQWDYDERGYWTEAKGTMSSSAALRMCHSNGSEFGRSWVDKRNHPWRYESATHYYDGVSRRTRASDPTGGSLRWVHHVARRVRATRDSTIDFAGMGTHEFADNGLLDRYTDLNKHVWEYPAYDDAGRLLTQTDPTSQQTTYTYDDNGSLKTVTIPTSPAPSTSTRDYDSLNRLTDTKNGEIENTHYEYDWADRQKSVTTPDSTSTTTVYDGRGRVVQITDPMTNTTDFTNDGFSRRTEMIDPPTVYAGEPGEGDPPAVRVTTTYTYAVNPDGSQKHTTTIVGGGPSGADWTAEEAEYDAAGRLTKRTAEPAGMNRVTDYTYLGNGWLESSTVDPGGLAIVTEYTYDGVGRQTSAITTNSGMGTTVTYTRGGWVESVNNGVTTTTYRYDKVGNRIRMKSGSQSPVKYLYDPANRLGGLTEDSKATEQAVDGKTIITYRMADGADRTLVVKDGKGNPTTLTHDKAHRIKSVKNAENEKTDFDYFVANRKTVLTAPDSGTHETVLNANRQVCQAKHPKHPAATQDYNALYMPKEIIAPDGSKLSRRYDKVMRLKWEERQPSSTGRGEAPRAYRKLSYSGRSVTTAIDLWDDYEYRRTDTFDAAGRIAQSSVETFGANIVTTHSYDLASRKHTIATGDQATTTKYNKDGTVESISDGHTTTNYEYYPDGLLKKKTVSGRSPINYFYDDAGRLTRTEQLVDGQNIINRRNYDDAGRLESSVDGDGKETKYKYDKAGRLVSETNPENETTTYSYDDNGRRTLVALPSGVRKTIKYNKAGEVIETAGGPEGKRTYKYDDGGRLICVTDANGRSKRTEYDGYGRKWRVYSWSGSEYVQFGYNKGGLMTSLKDARPEPTGISWEYDVAGRKVSMTLPAVGGVTVSETYDYDNPAGLMSKKTTSEGKEIRYTYHANGSVHTLQVVGTGPTVTYGLDSAGAVNSIADGSVTMSYVYDGMGRLKTAQDSGVGGTLAYSYNGRGLRTSMTGLPEGLRP